MTVIHVRHISDHKKIQIQYFSTFESRYIIFLFLNTSKIVREGLENACLHYYCTHMMNFFELLFKYKIQSFNDLVKRSVFCLPAFNFQMQIFNPVEIF